MKRLTMGAALGGLAVYLFDPESGEERRERLFSLWRENRGSAVQAGRAASQAAESARPLARRMSKAIGRGDWAEAFDRRRPAVSLAKLIGAAAIGGTLVYFLDPVQGSERREWLLSALKAGRQAARQTAKAVKPNASRVSDDVAEPVEGAKAKVR
jgi:gas vesicle protein